MQQTRNRKVQNMKRAFWENYKMWLHFMHSPPIPRFSIQCHKVSLIIIKNRRNWMRRRIWSHVIRYCNHYIHELMMQWTIFQDATIKSMRPRQHEKSFRKPNPINTYMPRMSSSNIWNEYSKWPDLRLRCEVL